MRSAVLVIDVQEGLFSPEPFEAVQVVNRINALTRKAREVGVDVFFVQHETLKPPLTFGSDAWQLVHGLAVEDEDVRVRKTTPDSFLRTELEMLLRAKGINHLIICGYASEFCVDTTVRRAAALGFSVMLVSDAHTTHDKEHATGAEIRTHHNATLPEVTSFGPEIRAVASVDIQF